MKKYIFFLVLFLIMFSCTTNKQNRSKKIDWISFDWANNKVAISIPFKIQNIPDNFKAQLDLGSPTTGIYGNTFKPYLDKYPELKVKIDTINRIFKYNGILVGEFKNIDIKLGNKEFNNRTLSYYTNIGQELSFFEKNNLVPLIGTVGVDLFKNKYLIIDYANKRLLLSRN